jgi:teichuronopeptide biosynthesis TupA-like protein
MRPARQGRTRRNHFAFRAGKRPLPLLKRSNVSCLLRILKDYHEVFDRYPNLLRPKRFTEKLQWRKLFDRNPLFSVLSDKIAVREFIASRVSASFLPDLLWVGDNPDDIPFDALEPPYIVKCTHGAGFYNAIVAGNESLDVKGARERLRHDLARNFAMKHWEPGYFSVPRRLIAERLLLQPDGSPPVERRLFVFDGHVRVIHTVVVAQDRTRYGAVHDCDWNLLGWQMFNNVRYEDQIIPRPEILNDLIELAERLGAGFDFIRVDTYDWADAIRVGELTLYNVSGLVPMKPDESDFALGSYWQLEHPIIRALLSTLRP